MPVYLQLKQGRYAMYLKVQAIAVYEPSTSVGLWNFQLENSMYLCTNCWLWDTIYVLSNIRTIVLKYIFKCTRIETPQPQKTEITTHAVKGAILRARVLDTQKPAPPVANQNSDTFWNNEPSFKVPDFFLSRHRLYVQCFTIEMSLIF